MSDALSGAQREAQREAQRDTQWPRYQVFIQEKEGEPHQDAGSVHAPDPEMALQNARDVFVRRPECFNLWVVPTDCIFSKTRQELETWTASELPPEGDKTGETYHVFCKSKAAGTQTLVGQVEAPTPAQALKRAVQELSREKKPFAWWVFPARLVFQSDPQDVDSLFAPAREKTFRMSTDFHTLSAMRKIKKVEADHEG